MDPDKNKKLQQYATILTDQAKEAEQAGKSDEAIKHYLKLVDVLLVLASEAPDQNTWRQYIRQAEAYQTRIRSLVPVDQTTQSIEARIPPPPSERSAIQSNAQRPASPLPQAATGPSQGLPPTASTSSKQGPISKIFKPFQSGSREVGGSQDELTSISSLLSPNLRQTAPQASSAQSTQPQAMPMTNQKLTTSPSDERSPVPRELYERALSENKVLHERLQSIIKESDDKVAFLESRNRELEERIAMTVSRSDYEQLRAEFENMVPKHEYDRIRTELSNTVPISHYDQLLDRIANMIPREIYMASERRILELEDKLRHSVPVAVIDDIANEVSYVSILAEVPPIVDETPKKEDENRDRGQDALDLLKDETAESRPSNVS